MAVIRWLRSLKFLTIKAALIEATFYLLCQIKHCFQLPKSLINGGDKKAFQKVEGFFISV